MPIPFPNFPDPQGTRPTRISPPGRTLHLPENNEQAPEKKPVGYSCVMSWTEFTGGAEGEPIVWEFNPDPVRIGWPVNAMISLMPTRGGQVAYSTGRTIGPLTITGYVRSRWDLLAMADFIYAHMEAAQLRGRPLRFVYPERDFDFGLYIQTFNEIGLDGEMGEITGYTITAQITQDFTALNQAKVSQLMPGIPENVEWIDVASLAKIAEKRFGFPNPAEAGPKQPEGEEKPPEEETPEGAPGAPDKPPQIKAPTDPLTGSGPIGNPFKGFIARPGDPVSPTITTPPSTQPPQFGGP